MRSMATWVGVCALTTVGGLAAAAPASAQRPVEVWTAISVRGLVHEIATASGAVVRADATSRIVHQIASGAPADVLVTADRVWMLDAVERGLVDRAAARLVALNRMVLMTDGAASAGVELGPLEDLSGAALLELVGGGSGPALAVAGPAVPAGRYARQAIERLGVADQMEGRLVTVGNARAVVNTVLTGELTYGLGYRSDALAEPTVRLVAALPSASHDPAEVWVAPIVGAPGSATAFVDRLTAVPASRLAALGFDAPAVRTALPAPSSPSTAQARPVAVPSLGPVLARTVVVGLLAVLLATLPAVLLGRWLARSRSGLKGPVGTLLLLPLVLPPVVTGFLLLALVGSSGLLGGLLGAAGVRVSFTLGAAVLAAAVVGFPLYAVVVRNAFEAVDPRYEELAWTLGSPPRSTFRRVALPLALPGVAAGAVLALARGLGEFGATVVVAGNIEGRTQTLALAVYQLLESPDGRGQIWAFVGASFVIAAVGLAAWEWLSARHRARLLDGGGR